jgi:hypothetical protein
MAPRSLDAVRDDNAGVSYPGHALIGHRTALCLFAAAFHGRNDAYWLADAGLLTTCVDTDRQRLDEMKAIYPNDWGWEVDDAFAFADMAAVLGRQWDVVSLDPFTNLIPQCVDMITLWCHLARHVVILGTLHDTPVWAPNGWRAIEARHRSNNFGGVYWTVLER